MDEVRDWMREDEVAEIGKSSWILVWRMFGRLDVGKRKIVEEKEGV